MTISYPLNLPSTPSFSRLVLTARTAVSVLQSPYTFQTQVQEHQGQIWLADFVLPAMSRDRAEAWAAFLMALNGPVGTFFLGDPLATTPRGAATGTPLVNGASQTGKSIITDGWNPSVTGILLGGDFIQIGNRLHKVMQDVNSDGSGNATIDIFPRLRESPGDNQAIITQNCKGLFRILPTTNPLPSADFLQVYDFGMQAIEAI